MPRVTRIFIRRALFYLALDMGASFMPNIGWVWSIAVFFVLLNSVSYVAGRCVPAHYVFPTNVCALRCSWYPSPA